LIKSFPHPQRACEQWFCRLDGLAEQARRALDKVTLVPAQGAAQVIPLVFQTWVQSIAIDE
jgi:hypothetical protein